jgi:hypothetical protein
MTLTEFLRRVIEILDEAGVPYMLTGSLASAYYAIPRATQDLDVVIATDEGGVEEIVRGLQNAEWYVDRNAAVEAYRTRGQFSAIDPSSGWKVDFIIRKDRPYSRTEFDRRERVSLLDLEVSIASLEDILIAKLEWSRLGDSALQRRDVQQLLERAWERLDRDYVEKWVEELGLRSEWENAHRKLTEAKGDDGV